MPRSLAEALERLGPAARAALVRPPAGRARRLIMPPSAAADAADDPLMRRLEALLAIGELTAATADTSDAGRSRPRSAQPPCTSSRRATGRRPSVRRTTPARRRSCRSSRTPRPRARCTSTCSARRAQGARGRRRAEALSLLAAHRRLRDQRHPPPRLDGLQLTGPHPRRRAPARPARDPHHRHRRPHPVRTVERRSNDSGRAPRCAPGLACSCSSNEALDDRFRRLAAAPPRHRKPRRSKDRRGFLLESHLEKRLHLDAYWFSCVTSGLGLTAKARHGRTGQAASTGALACSEFQRHDRGFCSRLPGAGRWPIASWL